MHGHTRPAGQQKPSPPVTARPILSIHPNRLGPSGLDRAIADRHARRGDANSHSPEGANVRFCVCWSTEVKWRGQSRSRVDASGSSGLVAVLVVRCL